MGGNYKTVTTYQPKSINHSSDDERNQLETATQIIINENSIRDYDVWPRILNLGNKLNIVNFLIILLKNGRSGEPIFKANGVLDDSQGCFVSRFL